MLGYCFLGEVSHFSNTRRCCEVSEREDHASAQSPVPRRLLAVQPRGDQPPGEQGDAGPALPAAADRPQLLPDRRRQPGQQVPRVHRAAGWSRMVFIPTATSSGLCTTAF